jgi:hypothetical protein
VHNLPLETARYMAHKAKEFDCAILRQVGVLAPEPTPTGQLHTGQVGYVILGIKTTKAARVGDTLHLVKRPVEPLPGFRPAKSMVFAGLCLYATLVNSATLPTHNVCHRATISTDGIVWSQQSVGSWMSMGRACTPLACCQVQGQKAPCILCQQGKTPGDV